MTVTKTKTYRMGKILQAAFPGLEIADAREPLHLFPSQEDFEQGVRMDPHHCGFANCAHRVCGSTAAYFFKRYVYLDRFDEDGKRKVFRYTVTKNVFDALAAFDQGKRVKLQRAFILRAPSESDSIKGMRVRNKAYRRSDVAKAIKRRKKAEKLLMAATGDLKRNERIWDRAKDKPAQSKRYQDAQQRLEASKGAVAKARDEFDAAKAREAELRTVRFATAAAREPVKRAINIRNGRGQLGTIAKHAEA
jgi:hypothetical protein